MLRALHRFAHHRVVNVVTGLLTIGAAVGELLGDQVGLAVDAAHGLLLLGILHTLKALPELVEGMHKLAPESERARER